MRVLADLPSDLAAGGGVGAGVGVLTCGAGARLGAALTGAGACGVIKTGGFAIEPLLDTAGVAAWRNLEVSLRKQLSCASLFVTASHANRPESEVEVCARAALGAPINIKAAAMYLILEYVVMGHP